MLFRLFVIEGALMGTAFAILVLSAQIPRWLPPPALLMTVGIALWFGNEVRLMDAEAQDRKD